MFMELQTDQPGPAKKSTFRQTAAVKPVKQELRGEKTRGAGLAGEF